MVSILGFLILAGGKALGQPRLPVRTDVEPRILTAADVRDPRQIPVATGASVPEDLEFQLTLHVAPDGDDANDGLSPRQALRTPQRAVARAWSAKAEGRNARVVLAAGVYNSGLGGHANAVSEGWLVIEGDPDGGTIFDGAQRFEDWRRVQDAEANLWEREWPHDWRVPAPARGPAPPISRRREMLFKDGQLLRLRLAQGDNGTHPPQLGVNEFSISEQARTVRVRLPEGEDANVVNLELTMGNIAGGINRVNNLILRNLTFRRSAAQGPSLWMQEVNNGLLDRVTVEWSATNGMGSRDMDNITIRDSSFSHISGVGLWMHRSRNVLVERSKFNGNNWRGHQGGYYVWGPCGFKFMWSRTLTVRDSQAIGNYATGMWVDVDAIDTRIERNVIVGNLTRGLHMEANQGPGIVRHNLVAFNRRPQVPNFWPFGSGIAISQQFNLLVEENIVYGNDVAQIGVRSDFVARRYGRQGDMQDMFNFETREPLDTRTRFLEIRRNVVVATTDGFEQRALSMPGLDFDGGEFHKTLTSDQNLFWHVPGGEEALVFRIGVVRFVGPEGGHSGPGNDPENQLSWVRWRDVSGQERASRVADPHFVDPENGDFTVKSDSPVADWGLPSFRIDPQWIQASRTIADREPAQ